MWSRVTSTISSLESSSAAKPRGLSQNPQFQSSSAGQPLARVLASIASILARTSGGMSGWRESGVTLRVQSAPGRRRAARSKRSVQHPGPRLVKSSCSNVPWGY